MKVVLSRKGMDATYGGLPSPVLTLRNGWRHFYPLPIPFRQAYSRVHYNDVILFDNYTAWNFIQDAAPNYKQSEYCHPDPDLRSGYLVKRPEGWKPAFGQLSASQAHLANNGIGIGDVFLFFGWFQFAEINNGKVRYVVSKDYPNGFHAIYGYLQIEHICKPCSDNVPVAIAAHPHVQFIHTGSSFNHPSNTVYIAGDSFVCKHKTVSEPGAGSFVFDDSLVLTQKGQKNRTIWELPAAIHPDNGIELSYNTAPFWKRENGRSVLSAYSRGQEFVFKKDTYGAAEEWCAGLIKNNTVIR